MIFIAIFAGLFFLLWGVFLVLAQPMTRVLHYFANKTARLRYRDYAPVLVLVIVAIFVTAWAGDQFLDLAELLRSNNPALRTLDSTAHKWAVLERSPGATLFFTTFTVLGGPVSLGVVVAIVGIILAIRKRWRWLAYLAVTSAGGGLLVAELKRYFARARPDLAEALRKAAGYSFPSGHAMGSTIIVGALTYLAFRVCKTWKTKAAALASGTTFVSAVAFSRVYLGVHWISDILAGVSVGLVWLTLTTIAYEATRRIRLIRALKTQAKMAA